MKISAIEFAKLTYNSWGGRYFSAGLLAINPLVFKWISGYKIIPLLFFVFTFLANHFFIRIITKKAITSYQQVIASLTLTTLYIYNMPDITEGFYWMASCITYQSGNILLMISISFIILYLRTTVLLKKILVAILLFLLILASVGCNEITMLILILLILFAMAMSFYKKEQAKWFWLYLFCIVGFASYLVITAPGNSVRGSFFPNQHHLVYSTTHSIAQMVRFCFMWALNIPFLLLTLCFIPVAYQLADRIEIFKKHFYVHPIITFLLFAFVLFMTFFAVYWSMGMLAQHRTVNISYFIFLIGWFLNIQILISFLKKKYNIIIHQLPSYFYLIAIPTISIAFLSTGNTITAYKDIFTKKACLYNEELNKRFAEIQNCREKNQNTCIVDSLSNKPKTIYFIDITNDSDHWINKCYSSYFLVDSISIKK